MEKIKNLWFRLLDWMFPRYFVGSDFAYGWLVTVVIQRKRDGTFLVVDTQRKDMTMQMKSLKEETNSVQ